MIRLGVNNISRCYFLNKKNLKEIVRFILKSVGVFDVNLSIVFATDNDVKRLNYLYRSERRPTDVLSFPMKEGKRLKGDSTILGDVVISVDRAKKQAKRFDSTFKKEIYLYIIHGILHLVGYSDEKPLSKERMRKKEIEILSALLSHLGSRL